MSGLFGAKASSVTPQVYTGIQVSTSMLATPIPLVYGMTRVSQNLIWYGNFKSSPNKNAGGKGGGGSQPSSYSYSAAWAAALCEGPINGVAQIWHDRSIVTLKYENLTLFLGASAQPAWTIPPPAQQIPYDHIAYVATSAFNLGDSASMPNLTYEVQALLYNSGPPGPQFGGNFSGNLTSGSTVITNCAPPGALAIGSVITDSAGAIPPGTTVASIGTGGNMDTITMSQAAASNAPGDTVSYTIIGTSSGDADISQVIVDYLTDPNHGAGYIGTIASLAGNDKYQGYLFSLGIGASPIETTQRQSKDFLAELMQISNSELVESAGTLKVIPYADASVSGNGMSFAPNLTPDFVFGDDDYIATGNEDPVVLTRRPLSQTYNYVTVEYLDRANHYNVAASTAFDLNDINNYGLRLAPTYTFHQVTNPNTARTIAQLLLQASLFRRNNYRFKVRADYCLLEPMDVIGITDSGLGIAGQLAWITQITDTGANELEIEALEITGLSNTHALYNWAAAQGNAQNTNASPGSVLPPSILFMPPAFTRGDLQIAIAVGPSSNQGNWGGCNVYMSLDGGSNYVYVGTVTTPACYGTLVAPFPSGDDPDTADTLALQLYDNNITISAGTQADADNMQTLMNVDGEIVAYSNAAMVGAGQYNLDTYIRRGLYGTAPSAHPANHDFVRLDGRLFMIEVDPGMVGQRAFFKFCSFNSFGRATEDISTVTPYSRVIQNPTNSYTGIALLGGVAAQGWIGFRNVVVDDSGIFKIAAPFGAAWDSSAVTSQGYPICYVSAKPVAPALHAMIGFTSQPQNWAGVSQYANLDFAWYCNGVSGWYIYENGVIAGGPFGPTMPSTTDVPVIFYNSNYIVYVLNGIVCRTVSVPGLILYGAATLNEPGAGWAGVEFGGQALIPVTDTAQLGGNAATAVLQQEVVGPIVLSNAVQQIASITVGPYAYDTTLVLTLNGFWDITPGASSNAPFCEAGFSTNTTGYTLGAGSLRMASTAGMSNGIDYQGIVQAEVTYALAANTSGPFYFNADEAAINPPFKNYSLFDVLCKIEVIKR